MSCTDIKDKFEWWFLVVGGTGNHRVKSNSQLIYYYNFYITDDGGFLCRRKVSHNSHEEHLSQDYSELRIERESFTVMLSIAEIPSVIFSPDSLGIMKTKREITLIRKAGRM